MCVSVCQCGNFQPLGLLLMDSYMFFIFFLINNYSGRGGLGGRRQQARGGTVNPIVLHHYLNLCPSGRGYNL